MWASYGFPFSTQAHRLHPSQKPSLQSLMQTRRFKYCHQVLCYLQVVVEVASRKGAGLTVKGACAPGPICVSRCLLVAQPAGIVAGCSLATASRSLTF